MKKDRPMVSVIVPIYMIDRYIGLCIESILNQTYDNLEIILVDDGSPDRCPEICDLYAKKDKRIRVVHKENGGLVSARKAGLQASTGEYITYVDGDDWIGYGHIGSLVAGANAADADIVCAGFTRDLFNNTARFHNAIPFGMYEGEDLKELLSTMMSRGIFYRPGIFTYVWNKLFRREILMDAQMDVDERISLGEDGAVTYPALLKCRRVAVTESSAYHYRQREDSMLKQRANYSVDAQKLRYLYDYMCRWSEGTPPAFGIRKQLTDYVLSMAIIRSGGRIPDLDQQELEEAYGGSNMVLYGARTFGQQLMMRFRETNLCNVVAWVDDYYWEHRRCCLDVDPVETVAQLEYDNILIAQINTFLANRTIERLLDLGVSRSKILTINVPEEGREPLLQKFLNVEAIRAAEESTLSKSV